MASWLLLRDTFHLLLSFFSRTSVHQKTPKNVFKNTLLSSSSDVIKMRSQIRSAYRNDIRESRRSWSYAKEVAEWSRCSFYGRRLRYEFPGGWNTENCWSVYKGATDTGKTTTIAWRKGPLFSRKKSIGSGSTDDSLQEWSKIGPQPKKGETRFSQVWLNLFFIYVAPSNFPKVLRQVLWNSPQFVVRIILQVVHSKLSR